MVNEKEQDMIVNLVLAVIVQIVLIWALAFTIGVAYPEYDIQTAFTIADTYHISGSVVASATLIILFEMFLGALIRSRKK